MPRTDVEDEDQRPWRAPGPQGFLRGFGTSPATDAARGGATEPPPPVRTGDDAESERMRRAVAFLLFLACLALLPLIGLGIRLAR